jgi:hypothetical protein
MVPDKQSYYHEKVSWSTASNILYLATVPGFDQAVTIVTCIREVTGLSIDRDTYFSKFIVDFHQSLFANTDKVLKPGPNQFLPFFSNLLVCLKFDATGL